MRAVRSAALCALAAAAACGRAPARPTTPAPPPSTRRLGSCGDPERDGVLGAHPSLERADRDLDGDGSRELVVADRSLCTGEGNCYWNVFVRDEAAACQRYAGTIAGAALEPLSTRGEARFRDLRGCWRLTSGGRLLLQEYRYRLGGYAVIDALLCVRRDDDRILCADEPGPGPGAFTSQDP